LPPAPVVPAPPVELPPAAPADPLVPVPLPPLPAAPVVVVVVAGSDPPPPVVVVELAAPLGPDVLVDCAPPPLPFAPNKSLELESPQLIPKSTKPRPPNQTEAMRIATLS